MAHLLFIRHGETELNRENKQRKVFNGQAETQLTELGEAQAVEAGKEIAGSSIIRLELAVSSTLKRSIATAQHFLAQLPHDVPLHLSDALKERSLGKFEGKYVDDVFAACPQYRDDPAFKYFRHHFVQKAPDGENLTDVTNRSWSALRHFESQTDGDIAIFSHAMTIRCLLGKALELSEEEIIALEIPNAKPVIVRRDGGKHVLVGELPKK